MTLFDNSISLKAVADGSDNIDIHMDTNGVEDSETMSDEQEHNIGTFESEDESVEDSNDESEKSDCDEDDNADETDTNEEESDGEKSVADGFEEKRKGKKQLMQVTSLGLKIDQVKNDQNEADQKFCKLVGEKEQLLKSMKEKEPLKISEEERRHYNYILPLVKEIQLLELKVKEKQEKYDQLQLDKEIVKEQSLLLADCLSEEDSILKVWSKQLLECKEQGDMTNAVSKLPHINNVNYTAEYRCDTLHEHLAFTVLCQLVHVRVKIKVTSVWPSPLFGHPEAVALGAKSDTFIPGLSERVVVAFKEKYSASELVSFVDVFIAEDMAPFAIICPVKKAKKKLKNKDK